MKNKLHKNNMLCHPKLVLGSHFQISKLLNLQILSILFFLSSFFSQAQTYNWKWAMKGGGSIGGTDEEQIYDVKVGTDGNYYFIGTMIGNQSPQLNGQTVTVYNSSMGGNDIFLFSTTCDGTIRWSQAIGGQHDDRAYNLVLDSNNNVYIGAYVTGGSNYNIHFSPNVIDDITPYPANMNAHKRIYLVKYNSNGVFQSKKALQGTVNGSIDREAVILDLTIDSQNKLHFIVGLLNGTHLDNQVTVPAQYMYYPATGIRHFQYRLVQYNTNLNYVNSMVLPIEPTSIFNFGMTRFAYDETLNQYYIAGMRSIENSPPVPLSYNGDSFIERSYILALNGSNGNEVWRREVYADPTGAGGLADNRFNSLVIDNNSDVYFGGRIFQSDNAQNPVKIYDPTNTTLLVYTQH